MLNKRYLPALVGLFATATSVEAGNIPFRELAPSEQWPQILVYVTIGFLGAIGFVALLVFYSALRPASVRRKGDYVANKPWRSFLAGILVVVVVMLAFALINVLPEPLRAIPAMVIFFCAVYLLVSGLTAVCYEIGDRFLSSLNSRFVGSAVMSVIVGGTVYAALGLVPIVGWIVQFVTCLLAFGTALLEGRARKPAPISDMATEIQPPPVAADDRPPPIPK